MSASSLYALRTHARWSFAITTSTAACLAVGLSILVAGSMGSFALKAAAVPLVLWMLVRASLPQHLPHTRLGPANHVTLARSVCVAMLAAMLGAPTIADWPELVALFAAITLVLDGVDGLVARHFKVASGFGASLDGELDALLVLVLSALVWQLDRSGAWVLLAGTARFAFLAGMYRWPWMRASLPESNHRKLCFAFFVCSLVVIPMPWISIETAHVLSFFATTLVLLSFAVDVAWLRAHGRGEGIARDDLPPAAPGDRAWGRLLKAAHSGTALVPLTEPADRALLERFAPALGSHPHRPFVVGHLAQSIDGHIALESGASQWISGPDDLVHTHRLRALVDAVLVGAETAICDNPRLTVRETSGPHPTRVILDPNGRLDPACAVCLDTTADTVVLVKQGQEAHTCLPERVQVVEVPHNDGFVSPQAILAALHTRGIRRVLVEGGGVTVSRFIEAGMMDRLHLTVAPMWLGGGRPALHLPVIDRLQDALRPPCRVDTLGGDVLFDFDLSGLTDQ